jgi:hypothetical protein
VPYCSGSIIRPGTKELETLIRAKVHRLSRPSSQIYDNIGHANTVHLIYLPVIGEVFSLHVRTVVESLER